MTVSGTGGVSYVKPADTLTARVSTSAAAEVHGWFIKDPTFEQVYTDILPFSRYGIDATKTIILKDGVITVTDCPLDVELLEADAYYQGGHFYSLTQAEYDALVAAGGSQYVEAT